MCGHTKRQATVDFEIKIKIKSKRKTDMKLTDPISTAAGGVTSGEF